MADGNTITRKLPSEILFFQILPKLPVKALPNFMCVCKKWHSFLKSSVFANAYNHHHQNHPKHLVLSPQKPYKFRSIDFRSIDCESPKDSLTAIRPLPFCIPHGDGPSPGNMTILTSLHGLLCVGITDGDFFQKYSDFILWNPLTGGYKTLSKKGCHEKECYEKVCEGIFGLYYISSDDDYRLLRVTPDSNIYIYSLKSDSWRNVESTEDFQQRASNWALHGSFREQPSHIFLNEKLYLLKQVDRSATFIQSYSIMRFDTMTEKFTEIEIPSFGNQMTSCLGFMVLRGCIHFWVAVLPEKENYMTNRRCYEMIELWRMDGDGDGDGDWTKVLTYGPMLDFIWGRSLLHFMGDGNLLIKLHGDVYILDIKKHTKEIVFKCESLDDKHSTSPTGTYIETIPEIGKYIETTLSPNQYDQNRKWSKYNFRWCTYRSWERYEAYERAMIEKYGEDVTKHPRDDAVLWAQSFGGRKKDCIFGIGSPYLHLQVTKASSYGYDVPYVEYAHLQQQVRELQIQIEMERKAREEMQEQMGREREIERKARDEMQTQITELMRLYGKHPKNPPNSF